MLGQKEKLQNLLYTTEYKRESVNVKKSILLRYDKEGRAIGLCSMCFRTAYLWKGETPTGKRWVETHHLIPNYFPSWIVAVCNNCHQGKNASRRGYCLHNPKVWSERNAFWVVALALLSQKITQTIARNARKFLLSRS